jgi:pentafunctional AROM polypeptide
MVYSLKAAGLSDERDALHGQSGLVVGSGGTSRAAIFALNKLGFSPIYVVARKTQNVKALADAFAPLAKVVHVVDQKQLAKLPAKAQPTVVISTIPSTMPVDANMREILAAVVERPASGISPRVFLDMAYKPDVTPLMQLAEDAATNWVTIGGMEVLVAQGWYQVCSLLYSLSRSFGRASWH